jgi:tetratricopeptide (TPR) repeat protein
MLNLKSKPALAILLFIFGTLLSACSGQSSSTSNPPVVPVAAPIPADSSETVIRELERRVKSDKDDFMAYNKLAGYYLQKVRETGNLNFLDLASRAAKASLEVLPAEQNIGGLAALAQVEFVAHDFAAARDHAQQLIKLDAKKSYPYQLLGDALIELGDYDKATAVFYELEQRSDGAGVESRRGRLALLRGDTEEAKRRFARAIIFAQHQTTPSREAIAWNRWQLGEIYFSTGDYEAAETHYRDSLITFPDYYRALASLGRVLAAKGDLTGAIENYERAARILPDPTFVAALGDLYQLAGRDKDAQAQYALIEQINKINTVNGALYNRQIALFYADHDLKADDAYQQAKLEYETRRDIYGADAVAWTALKAGKIAEAQLAIKEAMRLGTRDARLFYHAGMIAQAAGDRTAARENLQRALALNPQFDALQAAHARQVLASLN